MQEQATVTEAAPPEQAKTLEAALSPGQTALPEAAALTEQAKTREAETMREQAPAQAAAAEPGALQKQEPAVLQKQEPGRILQKQEPAGIDLLELKRNLGQGFQKQRFVAQALAACELEQDGNRIIMKALYDFHQEMLAKEENRHKLQEALRHHYPDLELEIVTLANPPEAAARAAAQPASQQGSGRRSPGRAADQTAPLQGATLPEGAGGSEPPPPDREAPAPFVVTPSLFDLADPDADFDAGPDADRVAEPDAVVGAGRLAGEDAGSDSDPVGVALTLFNGEIINEKKEAD